MIEKAMKAAHLVGYEYAMGLVEINVKHGLPPLDGVREELNKLKEEIENE